MNYQNSMRVDPPFLPLIPLPIPDPQRSWGKSNCTECTGLCAGHFLKSQEAFASSLTPILPPLTILKQSFHALGSYPPKELLYQTLAQETLLKIEEVKIWLEQLNIIKQNRRKE